MKLPLPLLLLGLLLLASSTYGQSTAKLRQQLQQARHDTTRLRLYCQLGDSLKAKNSCDSLYVLVQQALPLAVKSHSVVHIGRLYAQLGFYYRMQRLVDKGITTMHMSIAYLRQTNDTVSYARALYELGTLYGNKTNYAKAVEVSLQVLSMGTKINNAILVNAAYSLLIALYKSMNDIRSQAFYINQYLQFATRTHSPLDLYFIYMAKAELLDNQHNYHTAWPYYTKAFRIAHTLEPANVRTRTYYITEAVLAMERNLRSRQRYTEGNRLLQKAIRLNEPLRDIQNQVNLWNAMAQNYQKQGLNSKNLQAATKAFDYARQSHIAASQLTVLPIVIASQEANGYYREALANQKLFMALKDSALTREKNDRIAELQVSFDLDKKEQTIQLLNKNVQIQHIKANQQAQELALSKQQRLILITSIGVLVPLLGLIAYFLRQSRTSQAQMARQKGLIEGQAAQLQASNRFKDQLFSIVGHDLRSPVASLKASLTLARLRMDGDKPVSLDELDQQVNTLQHTLDNILYWSLNQQNGLLVRLQRVDLADYVSEILESFEGLIEHKQLSIHYRPSPAYARIDENLALIVLRNMLHNAIKFTPEGRRISVFIEPKPTSVELIIADEGIGMDVAQSTQLPTHGSRGTGLGLALSKELMVHAGGNLQIESQIGQGTTVTLSWPNASA